jgi:lipoprotein-releasing system permease protein
VFLLVAVGLFGAAALAPLFRVVIGDRLGLPPSLAVGLTALLTAGFAAVAGGLAAWIGRRLAFYEVAFASLLWTGLVALVLAVPRLRAGIPAVQALHEQGMLVAVLALVGLGLLGALAVFTGASLVYIVAGSGTVDLSLSYELFVARSHLRLAPRTLAGLFLLVVTGLVPGLLYALVASLVKDARERRAYRRGELTHRPRMPATLLMTLISIFGVALGVWALIVVLSVMSGFEADLKQKILGHTAHGMVMAWGQDDFGDWREARQKALKVRGVEGATPFLYAEVMLSSGQSLSGSFVKGIDVATIGSVTDLPRSITQGRLEDLLHPERISAGGRDDRLEPPPDRPRGRPLPGIVIGREMAHALRVFVGDEVSVLSPFGDLGPAGPQPKSRAFRVAAIFYSGMYEYDAKFAYMDLAEAQRFFGMEGGVTGLEVKVRDADSARAILDRVVVALGGYPYRAKDWGELNRPLFAALQMEKVVMAVILLFIVLVASFLIIATLIMQVLEKRKEIAVLKSMGAGVPSVMKIFVLEGLVIGAVGAVFGLILGLGTCLLVDRVGIPLNPEVYYISNLPVVMDPAQLVLVAVAALVLSYLATLYPAAKAARLHPVDGLRSE